MSGVIAPELAGELEQAAGALMHEAIGWRRLVHADPEIGLQLPHTQDLVGSTLERMGLSTVRGRDCSSVVAVIEGERDGPTTLLRADMDALEMPEDTGVDFASRTAGRMHACGHDAHTAMLLAATRVLHDRRGDLRGRVVLMFQPGEEGHDGAKVMLDEGLLEQHRPERAFALHISSVLPSGWISTRPGTLMASADEFHITVTGRGGHASMPHDAADPVPVACSIVTAIQSMVTRTVPAFDPAVVTVSTIHGGTATNVIPEEVHLGGTVRAVSDQSRDTVLVALGELSQGLARAHRCHAEMEIMAHSYPVTVCDDTFAAHTLSVAQALVGDQSITMPTPVMGAEDWSYVLRQVRGSMAFLGAAPAGVARPAPNHSNHFMIDENAMAVGIAMYAAMALSEEPRPE
ncbi:MAG: M20 family metallopeptidase [Actinomycetota bacterium]|nr:M20 family metallopeptidase [Actinomycetota bacterium]